MSTDRFHTSEGIADAESVAAIKGGDPRAWGEVFDRHRQAVWQVAISVVRRPENAEDVVQSTFLTAVESVTQLQDPSRLRPWLLTIARRRALDVVRRSREIAFDPTDPISPPFDGDANAGSDDEMISGLRREEMSRLVTAAFDGLEPRDRAALELAERQGMSGDDLAETLGVSRDNAYALVHNAKDRFGASVASLLVARTGRDSCSELESILGNWDGELTPLVRKRVTRHIARCATCGETRRLRVTPVALLALVPVVSMSVAAIDQSKAAALESAPRASSRPARLDPAAAPTLAGVGAKVGVLVATVVLFGVGAVWVVSSGDDDPGVGLERTTSSTAAPPETARLATSTSIPVVNTTVDDPPAESYCAVAGDLFVVAAAGPASGDSVAIETYLRSVNELVQRLVGAAVDDAGPGLLAYAEAYQGIIDDGVWDPGRIGDEPELFALRDAAELEISARCTPG